MTRITATRSINAPIDVVFKAVADIDNLPKTSKEIVKIEFLTDQKSGIGTRFRETRLMNGKKEMVTELEVTEYVENDRTRMVADSHGTIWDTLFSVKEVDGETELTLAMDAKPHKFLPKLMNPLMKGVFRKGIEKHMDVVKSYCEDASTTKDDLK